MKDVSKKKLSHIIREEILNEVRERVDQDTLKKLAREIESFQFDRSPIMNRAREVFARTGEEGQRELLSRDERVIADLFYALTAVRRRLSAMPSNNSSITGLSLDRWADTRPTPETKLGDWGEEQ